MIDSTPNPTRIQRTARRLLLGACTLLAIGLISSVAVRGESADPQARFVEEMPELEVTLADAAQLAAIELPADPVETIDPPAADVNVGQIQPTTAARVLWMEVTAYCPCVRCCGDDSPGITASGKPVSYNNGRFVAADTSLLPFGTKLQVPGYADGAVIEVIDRGGAIKGHRLDLYFDSHAEALQWGRQWVAVTIHE